MIARTHPARKRRWSWALGLALLLGACAPASAATYTQSVLAGPPGKQVKVLELEAVVIPSDPFSDANAVGAKEITLKPGEVFDLVLYGRLLEGWHTYPMTRKTATDAHPVSEIQYESTDVFKPLWPVQESEAEFVHEEGVGTFLEHKKPFTWSHRLVVDPGAKPGTHNLRFTVLAQVCKGTCVNGEMKYEIPVKVGEGPALTVPPEVQESLGKTPSEPEVVPVPPELQGKSGRGAPPPAGPEPGTETGTGRGGSRGGVEATSARDSTLFGLIFQGILWGAISLLTPCVFPMIPITVSFFIKRSEQEHHRVFLSALVYTLTIVVVLTLGGVVLLRSLQTFSTHYVTNLFLGGLFLFFALSLFGMYDIALPSGLANFTSSQQGKGGLVGVMFMALTFTIISFACVAPFYGGFIALTAGAQSAGDWFKIVMAALAFSVTFASPFFVLALFPTLLKGLPKSGSWMNTVKVVMGFLEVAAAVKFLRAAEMGLFGNAELLTFDFSLGIYVALALGCGVYLLGLYRLPHDHDVPETLGVPRVLFALLFLSLGLYLLPGLFAGTNGGKQQPRGAVYAWVNSFLLPDEAEAAGGLAEAGGSHLPWLVNLEEGLKQARAEDKLVFVDFTGRYCTNCRYNENSVFPKPAIKELLGRYVLVELYTDELPPKLVGKSIPAADNKQFQQDQFGTVQLPLYTILKPTPSGFEVVGQPYAEGKINDVEGFTRFLSDPLEALKNGQIRVAKK